MYLTAHRVEDRDGRTGINAFLYRHGEHELPASVWDSPDVVFIAEKAPGNPVRSVTAIPPGNNSVASYLDIVARNNTGYEALQSALMRIRSLLARDPSQSIWTGQPVGVRFSLNRGLVGDEDDEFSSLMNAALSVFRAGQDMVLSSDAPLTIILTTDADRAVFTFDQESTQRVVRQHERPYTPIASLTIKHEDRLAFEDIYGDLIQYVVTGMTDLTPDKIAGLGGVRIIREGSGEIVREYLVALSEDTAPSS